MAAGPNVIRRIPPAWRAQFERYAGGGAPPGALDDSRRTVRLGLGVAGLFFGVFLLVAGLAPLSGAAVAPGLVTVPGHRQPIQAFGGGMVTRLLVGEGQQVKAGQILVRLNGVVAGARLAQSQSRQDALRLAQARLVAERDEAAAMTPPADLQARAAEPAVADMLRGQQALFEQHRRLYEAETRIQAAKVEEAQTQVDGVTQQLALIRDELSGIQSLYRRGFAPKSRLLALERAQVDLRTGLAQARTRLAEAQLEQQRAASQRAGSILDQLRVAQEQLGQVNPEMSVSRFAAERDLLRAPFAGRVTGVAAIGPGTVLGSGQRVMDLLPDGKALIVEAHIKPQDIDDVKVGAKATVRFTTVNPRGRSSFTGHVTTLSPDRLADGRSGQSYFLAVIAIDDPAALARAGVNLQAGLPAAVNIKTRSRTLLDYLLAPLGDAISGSFREE